MSLIGADQLRRRMDALKTAFGPATDAWADETVRLARQRVPVRTGKTRSSIRKRIPRATSIGQQTTQAVVAKWPARAIEKGSKEYTISRGFGRTIRAKKPGKVALAQRKAIVFNKGGQTIFTSKARIPRRAPRPFLAPSAAEALIRKPVKLELVRVWNAAA